MLPKQIDRLQCRSDNKPGCVVHWHCLVTIDTPELTETSLYIDECVSPNPLHYEITSRHTIIIIILTPCGALPRPLGHAVPLQSIYTRERSLVRARFVVVATPSRLFVSSFLST